MYCNWEIQVSFFGLELSPLQLNALPLSYGASYFDVHIYPWFRLLIVPENYNKKIPPFQLDWTSNQVRFSNIMHYPTGHSSIPNSSIHPFLYSQFLHSYIPLFQIPPFIHSFIPNSSIHPFLYSKFFYSKFLHSNWIGQQIRQGLVTLCFISLRIPPNLHSKF